MFLVYLLDKGSLALNSLVYFVVALFVRKINYPIGATYSLNWLLCRFLYSIFIMLPLPLPFLSYLANILLHLLYFFSFPQFYSHFSQFLLFPTRHIIVNILRTFNLILKCLITLWLNLKILWFWVCWYQLPF